MSAVRALRHNGALGAVLTAGFALVLADRAVRVGLLVYAYDRGGATAAGLVGLLTLLPGSVTAPLLSTLADRRSPVQLLLAGLVVQALGISVTALAVGLSGSAALAYGGAALAGIAVTAGRPAQAALLPSLCRSLPELSAANVAMGWLTSLGTVLAGAGVGLALSTGEPVVVYAVAAALTGTAALLLCRVPRVGIAAEDAPSVAVLTAVRRSLRTALRVPQARLLIGLSTAQHLAIGALDVLFVVVAVSLLDKPALWSGYLSTGTGLGAVLASSLGGLLVARHLRTPLVLATGVAGSCLLVTAASTAPTLTLALLAAVGAGRTVVTTGLQVLLQRSIDPDQLGAVLGLTEGLRVAGLAVGSLLVPVLIALGGTTTAVVGTALVVPLALLLGARAVHRVDDAADVPVTEIALLRSLPHFRALPTPQVEGLARTLVRTDVGPGERLMTQGEVGDRFHILVEGQVEVLVDGTSLGLRNPPTGLGEIALLRAAPRSATVRAVGRVTTYALDGERFLSVVSGHENTRRRSDEVAVARLRADLAARPPRHQP